MHTLRRSTVLATTLLATVLGARAHATTITINPSSQDTFIREDAVNTIPGGGNSWRIRVRSRSGRVWRGLVQFDLSSIPQFSTINSATLKLRETGAALDASKTHDVYRINDPWLQSTTKWSNQPTHAGSATASTTVGLGNGDRTWGVTADVQAWVNAPTSNHGWMIIDQAEGDGDDDIVKYVARESRNNTTRKPKLDVDFTPPPCTVDADCADTNPCTENERCPAGFCVVDPENCDDSDACTDDICDPGQAEGSECLHTLGVCNDGFDCTIDTCDSQGGCTNTADDTVCTAGGCKEGTCVADPDDPTLDEAGCFITAVHADGTPCTDANACTDPDQCSGGQCQSGGPIVCTPLDQCHDAGTCDSGSGLCSNPPKPGGEPCDDANACTNDACDGTGQCIGIAAPQMGCRKPAVAKKALIILKDKSPDKKDTLIWKWNKGTATALGDFGAPLTTTGFTLCVYDQSGNPQPRLMATAPPEGTCGTKPCWKTTKTGYKYKDKFLDPDGVLGILLKKGADSTAKIVVTGKGPNLQMPTLPPAPKVTVQLKRNDDLGTCWDAEYTTPIKSQSDQFKALAD